MLKHLNTAIRLTIVSIVLLGLVYPLAMTAAAQAIFPRHANGSLVTVNGKVVGSAIIGQLWTKPKYFQGRPSAAGKGYDPTSTGGTNLGPTSKKLMDATRATIAQLRKDNPDAEGAPPIDLVTTSGSGIDPDISPSAAYWEAPRVAKARGLNIATVRSLVAEHVRGRTFGFLGEPRVNVLELNLSLDAPAARH
jgi:K+-transporting ATPase ATPase C chain